MRRHLNRRTVSRALGSGSSLAPLWALLAASALLPACLVVIAAWINYRASLADAGRELQRVAEVAREHAASTFAAEDHLTDRINDLLRNRPTSSISPSDPALHETLEALVGHVPQAQSVLLADAAGNALASAAVFPLAPGTSIAQRDYFQHIVTGHEPGPVISALQVSDISHSAFFGLARPWLDAAGNPRGVIDVAIFPPFFTRFYRFMVSEAPESAEGSMVMLVRPGGDILARYPPMQGADAATHRSRKFQTAVAASPARGTYSGSVRSMQDQPDYLFAYSKVENYPVYVVAGRRRDAIVAAYRDTLAGHVLFGLLTTVALVTMSLTALGRTRRERFALAVAKREMARRERAETALLRAQRLEAVGQMTGGVAHDFNNLLTLIMGSAELLERRVNDPARVRALAAQIVQASRRGGTITQQLLSFSRRQFMNSEIVELDSFLQEFRPLLERAAGEDVEVSLLLDGAVLNVRIDTGHLESALLNLVSNARDAMEGLGTLTIQARPVELAPPQAGDLLPGSYAEVTVTDTGVGMDAATLDKAFEPFFTTKGVGGGTGLGLSQVYGFAKQSGGEARIRSAPGKGTEVSLLLPRITISAPAVPAAQAPAASVGPDPTVLVVDGTPAVLANLAAMLHELGYRAITASSPAQALGLLQGDAEIDLLLTAATLDLELDGIALGLRARRLRPGIRLLIATSQPQSELPPSLPLLRKPYDRAQLTARLQAALGV